MKEQEATLELLSRRHSVRAFTEEPIEAEIIKELQADITYVNTHVAGLHFSILTDDPKPFESFLHSYGSFRNVRNYLACTVDKSFPNVEEKAGYYAEEFVMKCVAKGLGTCIVGGTFDSSKVNVQLRAGWVLPFVVVFGKAAEKESLASRMVKAIAHRKKINPEGLFSGSKNELERCRSLFPSTDDMLTALSYAPSALNKRPVRLFLSEKEGNPYLGARTVGKPGKYTEVDLGIAKYNMGRAGAGEWDWGEPAPFIPLG